MSEERDPVDLHALEAAKEKRAKAELLQQQIFDSDFNWFMRDKRGRRLMWGWLADAGVFRNPFVIGDQALTDFRCGEMNAGQRLHAAITRLCPELFHEMIKEQEDAERRRNSSSTDSISDA